MSCGRTKCATRTLWSRRTSRPVRRCATTGGSSTCRRTLIEPSLNCRVGRKSQTRLSSCSRSPIRAICETSEFLEAHMNSQFMNFCLWDTSEEMHYLWKKHSFFSVKWSMLVHKLQKMQQGTYVCVRGGVALGWDLRPICQKSHFGSTSGEKPDPLLVTPKTVIPFPPSDLQLNRTNVDTIPATDVCIVWKIAIPVPGITEQDRGRIEYRFSSLGGKIVTLRMHLSNSPNSFLSLSSQWLTQYSFIWGDVGIAWNLIDSWHLCIPQVPGGPLFCLPSVADDSLAVVRGWFREKAGARERAEVTRGNVRWTKMPLW